MKIRKFLYDSEVKRVLMRFVEIFLLAGLSALVNSMEVEQALQLALPVGFVAALLKVLRDSTNKEK